MNVKLGKIQENEVGLHGIFADFSYIIIQLVILNVRVWSKFDPIPRSKNRPTLI